MRRIFTPLALVPFFLIAGCNPKPAAVPSGGTRPTATTETGLKKLGIVDIKKGAATKYQKNIKPAAAGDKVWVYYTGRLITEEEIDGNDPKTHPEKWPLSFILGERTVIRGWEEGIVGMLPGGKRKLSIPWKLAYGEAGKDHIPPKTDLYFDVELLDVVKFDEQSVIDFYDEKLGSGPAVTKGKVVTVHFTIKTTGDHEVDNTRKRGKAETFTIGKDEVHTGFETGLEGMKAGGIRNFRLPPAVGFKIEGNGEIQPPELVSYFRV